MTNLGGLHDRESVALGVTDTWALDTIALSDNPASRHYEAGYEWIVRANWSYGSTGTLPKPEWYGEYVVRLATFVRDSQGCHRWVIGNEPNLLREWPDDEPIYPWDYAHCYKASRRAIHAIPGHEQDEVLIAASGPWNAELKYEGNPTGDWIRYFEDVIAACSNEIDGFAIHSYTHGYDVALVTSSARMQAPFQSRHYEFRTYRDYLAAIPVHLWSLPVYLTEANGNGPWQAVGLMPAMLGEVDHWNRNSNQPISAVIFFRYPEYDDFYIEGRADVIAEYKEAIGSGYQSPPVMGAQVVTKTFIPNISVGATSTQPSPALPPREWDERLTARGVTIQTPPIAPGQQFWRVAKARWYDEGEADKLGPDHHIMADVLDATGARWAGVNLEVDWPSGEHTTLTEAKPGEPYSANYPMSPSRNDFSVEVGPGGKPSERLVGVGMGAETPDGFNSAIHTSTGVVFQLATMPQTTPTPTQPVTTHLPSVSTGQTTPVAPNGSWQRSREFVKKWEGEYQNNPLDVGNWTGCAVNKGENKGTKYGISACSYPHLDIPNLTIEQADAIYFKDYWQASGADKLPWPYSLLAFDTAVLHGVGASLKWQQEAGDNPYAFAAKRLRVYTKLANWSEFGAGWVNRVSDLLVEASR